MDLAIFQQDSKNVNFRADRVAVFATFFQKTAFGSSKLEIILF